MNKYELMILTNASLSSDEKEAVFKEAVDLVSKSGGKVINSQVWLDKHKLSFTIKKSTQATYYLINFESLAPAINKIRQTLRLNEKVLRFLLLKPKG